MSATVQEFLLPEGLDVAALRDVLTAVFTCVDEPPVALRRTCYDSFDWRIHAAGRCLEHLERGAARRLQLSGGLPTPGQAGMELRQVPRFTAQLPPGPLREALAPLLEVRALLPYVTLSSRRQPLRVMNKARKTVLWVTIEQNRCRRPGDRRGRRLATRLRLQAVKGYAAPLRAAVKLCREQGLLPAAEGGMDEALRAAGVAGTRPGGLPRRLDPELRADAACKRIFAALLDAMLANEAGLIDDIDTEFLHDYRVAVRRTRALLGQAEGVLPQRSLQRFRAGFAWLGQVTGPVRDLDVYLLGFEQYRASLPPDLRGGLDPLYDFLAGRKQEERRHLLRALGSARYRRLVTDWRAFLEREAPSSSRMPQAARPIQDLADARIWRLYRRVVKEGEAIGAASPAVMLHELRKRCKKLRYLLEFFPGFYPQRQVGKLIKSLKILQNNLGEFQDLEVQDHALGRMENEMAQAGGISELTREAIETLIAELQRRQERARAQFGVSFAQFRRQRIRRSFRALFHEHATERPVCR